MVNDDDTKPGFPREAATPLDRVILGLEEIMSVRNTHKVDRRQWRKWNQQQRALFNGVYEDIKRIGPDLFLHVVTAQRKISDEEFEVLAWNAAWTAAHVLKGQFTDVIHTLYNGEVIATDHLARRAA